MNTLKDVGGRSRSTAIHTLRRSTCMRLLGSALMLWLMWVSAAQADVPRMINFQGRVQVNGTNYEGTGQFKFALVDQGTYIPFPPYPPLHLFTTYWSHDGSSGTGNEPTSAVPVTVTKGLYSVMLGDISLTNMLQTLPPSVFTNSDVYLRVWFNDGTNGFQQLSPDQRIAATAYALQAASVEASSITSVMLADGAVTSAKVSSGAITSSNLADGAITSSKLGTLAVKASHIDDGGNSTYDGIVNSARAFSTVETLPFSAMTQVSSNSGAMPNLSFSLDGSALGTVLGFVGTETISAPYQYIVEVILPSASLVPDSQMKRQAVLSFTRNGTTTRYSGLVTGCSVSSYDGSSTLYVFRVEPMLAYMGQTSDYRVFQQQSVPEIVTTLYSNVVADTLSLSRLYGTYTKRECTIQYGETALNFFSRLLENEGIFYFFQQSEGQPVLTLGDTPSSYLSNPAGGWNYYGNFISNAPANLECIRSFQKSSHASTKSYTIDSYNFKSPNANLLAKSTHSIGQGEQFEFGANTAVGDNTTLSQSRLDRQVAERYTMFGTGNAADLRAGYTFTLTDVTSAGLGNTYLATTVRHGAFRRITNGVTSFYYGNQFEVLPASLYYRPALKTPKPSAHACTAIVTGTAGTVHAHTDQYGRVKVQFVWDRYGTNDANSSAWIRVAGPAAGKTHGMMFIPRVDDEVLVQFIQGDPDQPVIIGSLYNGINMPFYALPGSSETSTIKSHSINNRTNEIQFDDTAGNEQMKITAERLQITAGVGIGINTNWNTNFAMNVRGTIAADGFQGTGSGLNNLPATALTGTVADGNLSTNIARLNASQSFGGVNAFLSRVGIGTSASSEALNIGGDARLNDHTLYLRPSYDLNHGVGWFGAGKLFAGNNLDGPVLFGCAGGGLGTACSTQQLALTWDFTGRITLDPANANNGSLAPGLNFGTSGGVGIASKRTAGGNQLGLDFYTASSNRLSIASGGNVGVGTTTPAHRLHVQDADGVSGSIQVGAQTVGPNPKLIYFGDGDFVHIGEKGLDDRMELKGGSFFFDSQGTGYVGIGTNTPQQKLHVIGNILASGTITPNSDRNAKTDFASVDTTAILAQVVKLPIQQWRFKTEPSETKHLGPMAQDFRSAFGLGEIPTAIATVDADGVTLAAIQGLNQKLEATVKEKDAQIMALEKDMTELKALVKDLLKKSNRSNQ